MLPTKNFDLYYERRALKIITDMIEQTAKMKNYPMRTMNLSFAPSTEKQKSMLAHQLRRSHDNAYENCLLDRAQIEQFKELNLAGKIDKDTTSDLITVLDRFVEAIYLKDAEESAPFAEAAKKTLNTLMSRIETL
jgi:hypothetical protein